MKITNIKYEMETVDKPIASLLHGERFELGSTTYNKISPVLICGIEYNCAVDIEGVKPALEFLGNPPVQVEQRKEIMPVDIESGMVFENGGLVLLRRDSSNVMLETGGGAGIVVTTPCYKIISFSMEEAS